MLLRLYCQLMIESAKTPWLQSLGLLFYPLTKRILDSRSVYPHDLLCTSVLITNLFTNRNLKYALENRKEHRLSKVSCNTEAWGSGAVI
jgi:hypothetical protein